MSDSEIIKRVLFEFAVNAGEVELEAAVDAAVRREDIQSAGGMPALDHAVADISKLVVTRYRTIKEERGLN